MPSLSYLKAEYRALLSCQEPTEQERERIDELFFAIMKAERPYLQPIKRGNDEQKSRR